MERSSIKEIEITTLTQFVAHVCQIESDWNANDWKICWFRGCGTEHSLLPGQFRSEYRNDIHGEESTFLEFKQQARGFLDKELNDWDLYFLMQHYRVPTRLLDWTSNCLVALYFALSTDKKDGIPCVWMLNPFVFNEHNAPTGGPYILIPPSLSKENYNEGSWSSESLHWMNYLHPLLFDPDRKTAEDKSGNSRSIERPVAISPPLLDIRVIAQSSFFTLHGGLKKSIDEFCVDCDESSHTNFIRKIVFQGDKGDVLRKLASFGVTRQRIYPDLAGLGSELSHRLMGKQI